MPIYIYIHRKGGKPLLRFAAHYNSVGVTGFEPATTRPPDAYSNRAELHPELRVQKYMLSEKPPNIFVTFLPINQEKRHFSRIFVGE